MIGRRCFDLGLVLLLAFGAGRKANSDRVPDRVPVEVHAMARQEPSPPVSPPASPLDEDSRKALLERWNRLTPEKQARVRERFERFRDLTVEQREILTDHARHLQRRARALYDLLTLEERERLDRLGPEKKREIMLAMANQEEQAQHQRLRQGLASNLRDRLEGEPPKTRRSFLNELHRRREIHLGNALRRLGQALGLEEAALDALDELPIEERKAQFLALAKELSIEGIARSELPPGLTPWRWERMRELPPEQFFAAVLSLRDRSPDFVPFGAFGPGTARGGSSAQPGTGGDSATPAPADRYSHRSRRSDGIRAIMRSIRAAARLDPSDMIELASLSPEERRTQVMKLRRQRVIDFMRRRELLPPERIDELEAQSDEWFMNTTRELSRPPASWREAPAILRELRAHLERRR